MKKKKNHLGVTKGQEWTLYRLKKGKADLELHENPFSGNRRDPSDFKVFLNPKDEEEVQRQIRKETADSEHKKKMAEIHAIKDAEMEARRKRYIETGSYD